MTPAFPPSRWPHIFPPAFPKDDAPVQTALNEGEVVDVEHRCKAFVWKEAQPANEDATPPEPAKPAGWSDRGVFVTRVVSGTGYGSFVVKQAAAPFKVGRAHITSTEVSHPP